MDADIITTVTLYDPSGLIAERHETVSVSLRALEIRLGPPVRRRIGLASLSQISAEGDDLVVVAAGERYELTMGDLDARTWADGLRTLTDALSPAAALTPP